MVPLLFSNSKHGFAATSSRGSVFIFVFIIAPHSFTAGSLHLKIKKQNKMQWEGEQWFLSSRSEGEETHLVFLGIWWFKHIVLNCLEIVAAKSSEHLPFPPSAFSLGSDRKLIKSHKFMTHRWLWALKSHCCSGQHLHEETFPNICISWCNLSPFHTHTHRERSTAFPLSECSHPHFCGSLAKPCI